MNFLAHLFLSGDSEDLIIGNFIGDAVKGSDMSRFSEGIRKGVMMHRAIDQFTDTHEIPALSRKRLHEKYHKYSGVIVDVYYDHFLAAQWEKFSDEPLSEFSQRMYAIAERYHPHLPEKSQYMLPFMKKHDWLSSYAEVEGIRRALTGMSRRTKFVSNMEFAADTLHEHYDAFGEEFHRYFPELMRFCETFR